MAADLKIQHEATLNAQVAAGAGSITINFASNSLPDEWAVGRTVALDYLNPVKRESFVVGGITGTINPFTVTLDAGKTLAYAHVARAPVKDITDIALVVEPVSRWIDQYCQVAADCFAQASVANEIGYAMVTKDGDLLYPAKKAIVSSVAALSYMITPDSGTVALTDLSKVWIENDWQVKVYASSMSQMTGRLMPGGMSGARGRKVRVTISYNGGYNPIPADLQRAGIILAARAVKSAAQGYSDVVGTTDLGAPVFGSSAIPREAKVILDRHQRWAAWVG